MKKIWSISTTLRNPERMRNFLIALKELDGKEWNNKNQEKFQILLIKHRFYNPTDENLDAKQIKRLQDPTSLTLKEAKDIFYSKKYEDPPMRGRQSFKPLDKMGLAFIIDRKIKISSLGKFLLHEDYDLGEMYFKSFLKWQYPNPMSRDFKSEDGYDIKPFVGVLHLINEVNKICKKRKIKEKGISKLEFTNFAFSLINFKDIKKQTKKIIDFRLKYEKIKDEKDKKKFNKDYQKNLQKEFSNATSSNLKDYSDNTIRYFRITRYIYIRGGGYYIDLEPRRIIEINKILSTDNASSKPFTKEEYINYLSDISQPILPWETEDELLKIYEKITKEINTLEKVIGKKETKFKIKKDKEWLIKEIIKAREYRIELQNISLKDEFDDIEKIKETINSLNNIRNLDDKPSIALEKWITIALNIINDAIKISPNYPVGDDNNPTFTAPPHKPDIECYYNSFNSICEVTLLTGRDQWFNEGQPVMRHFREFENRSDKDSYCIFIAPRLHPDTINTFWVSVKYAYQGIKQKIIPLSLSQIIQIVEHILELKQTGKNLSHIQFRSLLDDIIKFKDQTDDSIKWISNIPSAVNNFIKKLT